MGALWGAAPAPGPAVAATDTGATLGASSEAISAVTSGDKKSLRLLKMNFQSRVTSLVSMFNCNHRGSAGQKQNGEEGSPGCISWVLKETRAALTD